MGACCCCIRNTSRQNRNYIQFLTTKEHDYYDDIQLLETEEDNYIEERDPIEDLINDPELNAVIQAGEDFKQSLRIFLSTRDSTLYHLRRMKREVEESYDKSRKARIAGTVATTTGSTLAIIGFGLSFVTLGTSLGLSIAGGALAAAGGVTIAGAELGYHFVSKGTLEKAQEACDNDRRKMDTLGQQWDNFKRMLGVLADKHDFTIDVVFEIIKSLWKVGKPAIIGAYNSYNLIKTGINAGQIAYRAATIGKAAAIGTRTALSGLSTAAKVLRVGPVVVNAVFIPVDLLVMLKSAYDVHKYKTGKGSNSDVAEKIGNLINCLENHKWQIKRDFEELELYNQNHV